MEKICFGKIENKQTKPARNRIPWEISVPIYKKSLFLVENLTAKIGTEILNPMFPGKNDLDELFV